MNKVYIVYAFIVLFLLSSVSIVSQVSIISYWIFNPDASISDVKELKDIDVYHDKNLHVSRIIDYQTGKIIYLAYRGQLDVSPSISVTNLEHK